MPETPLVQTQIEGLSLHSRGKVRDIYDLGENLLVVTTDRLSAFDVVLPDGIPYKGKVLTALSEFWFRLLGNVTPHHLLTTDVGEMPAEVRRHRDVLAGRSMLVRKAAVFPVECVVRGYLSGSGWKDYKATGAVCGIKLPAGLRESEKLPQLLFTPSTKATVGHDENIDFGRAASIVGQEAAEQLRAKSLAVYTAAAEHALGRGIIIADTKFEWGRAGGEVILVDEVLTPDSSRFWPLDGYAVGRGQPSFDKQFVRDWLEAQAWDKKPPAPRLPREVAERTSEKYLEAYRRITGKELPR
ncbi:MAG: phosphoribosylaminoimidazolesuccinocarboxamide synthase [Planctomycetota bacterium]